MHQGQLLSQRLLTSMRNLKENKGDIMSPPKPSQFAGMVDFGSNDTLSLTTSGALTEAFLSELKRNPGFKVGSTSSRIFEGGSKYLDDLEHDLAQIHRAESALFFGSGFDANVALWSTIPREGDFILHDEYVHASIHDGMRRGKAATNSFPHNDCDGFRSRLQNLIDEHQDVAEGKVFVFVALESWYSMDGDAAPAKELLSIAKGVLPHQNTIFVIDEAHSSGLLGPRGAGFVTELGLEEDFQIRVHTCGKALSSTGAVILASPAVRSALLSYARNLIFSTAPSFVTLAAVRSGYNLITSEEGQKRRQQLQKNIRLFYDNLVGDSEWANVKREEIITLPTERMQKNNTIQSPIIALVTLPGKANDLAEYVRQAKFWVNVAQYPIVPKALERVRICIHAHNSVEEINGLTTKILEWAKSQHQHQPPLSLSWSQPRSKQAVTLVGAGTQGTRLAYMWSKLGTTVYLLDEISGKPKKALNDVVKLRFKNLSSEKWGTILTGSFDMIKTALESSWLVIECVPENLEKKRAVLQELDSHASLETIITSNSSSFTIADILNNSEIVDRGRFANLHSYWPPETTVVEIMGSENTHPEIITKLIQETRAHGFEPFHVRKQSTGFIFNRIWAAIKRESLAVLQEDVASVEEIDSIYKAITGCRKGPFEQMDIAGLDVIFDVEDHYTAVKTQLPVGPRDLLHRMVSSGKLGVKSRSGFYSYKEEEQGPQ